MNSVVATFDLLCWGASLKCRKTNSGWMFVQEANVKANVDGRIKHGVAEGKSVLDALKNVICQMLYLNDMEIDRKVKMVSDGDEPLFEVYIIFSKNGDSWHSQKVSKNVEEASFCALIEGFQQMFS